MEHQPQHKHKTKLKELSLELPKEYQKVSCPSCNGDVSASDLNIHDKIGKCVQCDVLFPLQDQINSLVNQKDTPKQTILRPEGIDIFRYKDDLEFSFREPFSSALGASLLFFPFFALLFTIGYFVKGTIPMLVPIGFWIPSLIAIYHAIIRSTMRITLNAQSLTVQKRPKKMVEDQSYLISDIDQLYVKAIVTDGVTYSVCIIHNGPEGMKHIPLISHLKSHSKAKFLEQEIEKHLGIIDREVLEAS